LNDRYVAEAARLGFRSRAAFKLIQIDERFRLLKPGKRVVDLGAAPGGWTQVAAQKVGAKEGKGTVVAFDILPMEPVPGVIVLRHDFFDPHAAAAVKQALGGPADVVLCDMAASATGHREVDHLRVIALAEAARDLAKDVLHKGGAFVAKLVQGGSENAFVAALRSDFAEVKRIKPPASRAESAEFYVVATGFRGAPH
jgi:23S rRNA (uridine2552-2'-O)-methyltransferase